MRLPPLIYNALGKFLLCVVLTVLGIALVADNGIVQRYRIMEAVRSFQSFFWERNIAVRNYAKLKEVNASLTKQNAVLLKQNFAYRNYIVKSRGEEKLAELSEQIIRNVGDSSLVEYEFTLAKVIKNTIGTEHNYLILDKGEKDGITEDMGVITPNGAIGITRAVGPKYTYVLSSLNEKQAVSARIGKSDAVGTLRWNSHIPQTATLTEIPLNVKVTKGDIVYTSGYSSFFPPNIPIGKAVSYKTTTGTHKEVTVRLLQDFKNLDYVIIVRNHDKKEIDSLSMVKPYSKNE